MTVEAPGLAHADLGTVQAAISTDGTSLQVLGSSPQAGKLSLAIKHTLNCPGASAVRFDVGPSGVAVDMTLDDGRRSPIGWIGKPFAVDSTGKDLPTWFEADGQTLRQLVDATGGVAPITFDPTYSFLDCSSGYYSDMSAYGYLNLNADDAAYCPVMGMFQARNPYRPVFGFETNVAREYGKIILRQDGQCSPPGTDTGPYWDFQVPCRAHDYCYDLRKAGFSGTVSDADWTAGFLDLMLAHCRYRILAGPCTQLALTYYAAVRLPNVVTDPDPGTVEFQNFNSSQCMDVSGNQQGDNAPVVQWPCNFQSSPKWKISPVSGSPGLFRLVAQYSQKCADTYSYGVTQWACLYPEQIVRIQGAYNFDFYTIRPQSTSFSTCFDVPGSSTTPGVQIITYSCFETQNQLWNINPR